MYTDLQVAGHDKAVVVLSGGLDSTTALALAKERCEYVYGVFFDYQQQHRKEVEAVQDVARFYRIPLQVIHLPRIDRYERPQSYLPPTWYPNRNVIFMVYASNHALQVGATLVVTGVHQEDQPGYPDCRYAVLYGVEMIVRESLCYTLSFWAPFLYTSKKGIVRIGLEKHVPYRLTWSCYGEGDTPCHECDACKRRELAFIWNETSDPLLEKQE